MIIWLHSFVKTIILPDAISDIFLESLQRFFHLSSRFKVVSSMNYARRPGRNDRGSKIDRQSRRVKS